MERFVYWPVDSPAVTQEWGRRPEYYSKFGLPKGHEGIDLRCPTGHNVYSATDGVVVQVGWRKPGHAYGHMVEVETVRPDGSAYRLIYAHGLEGGAKVSVGDKVAIAQLIMLGDNTGNSSWSHLHFTVKKLARGKAPQVPAGLDESDYYIMRNGDILINPALLMFTHRETRELFFNKED